MNISRLFKRLLALSLLSVVVSCSRPMEPIKIGAIIPITGKASQHVAIAEGMEQAIDEVNQYGGINGHPIEMVLMDSQTDAEAAKKAFEKIELENRPHLYVSSTSSMSIALAPLAENNEVVLAGLIVSSPKFTPRRKWSFRYHNSSAGGVLPNLKLLEEKGIKRLGVIYQNDALGNSAIKIIKEVFEKTGGTVSAQPFETKQADISAEIAGLSGMEAIIVIGFVKNTGRVLKKIHTSGYKGMKLSGPGGASLPRNRPELDELYVSVSNVYNSRSPAVEKVKQSYENRFNKTFTHQAATGYDFIMILNKILQNRQVTRENIQKALNGQISYSGIFGNINKKAGEHDIDIPMFQSQIIDGRLIYLQ